MALTKTTAEVDAWAEVAAQGKRLGAEVDVTDAYEATLHIDCALSSTTAHTGTEIIVQTSSSTGNENDNWSTLVRLIGPIGTAVSAAFVATENAGETVIAINNPVANNMDNINKHKFVENTTAADCEIVYQTEQSGDT